MGLGLVGVRVRVRVRVRVKVRVRVSFGLQPARKGIAAPPRTVAVPIEGAHLMGVIIG